MAKITPDRAYNEPGIGATEFIRAVMHDTTVPLLLRIDAANHLLRLPEPPPAVITIKIQGGVPEEPVDNDILERYPMLRLVQ
jgi:hypothetical protein